MTSSEETGSRNNQSKYKGVRSRKWGKWVSEIRVPNTQERLWLGSYSTPEAAAVAHDIAYYCLRRPSSLEKLNFPLLLPVSSIQNDMSPRSIQKVASDAGMAIDAQFIGKKQDSHSEVRENGNIRTEYWENEDEDGLSISIKDYL